MTMDKNEANKRLIEKINDLEKENDKQFSNTQKILLTTDGSITAIWMFYMEKLSLIHSTSTLKMPMKSMQNWSM